MALKTSLVVLLTCLALFELLLFQTTEAELTKSKVRKYAKEMRDRIPEYAKAFTEKDTLSRKEHGRMLGTIAPSSETLEVQQALEYKVTLSKTQVPPTKVMGWYCQVALARPKMLTRIYPKFEDTTRVAITKSKKESYIKAFTAFLKAFAK